MTADLLKSLLEGRLTDPDTGERLVVPTRQVVIAPSLRAEEAPLVRALGMGRRLALVADPTTWSALGARISGALAAAFTIAPVILPEHPHADMETVQQVRARSSVAEGLIAIGSGTINDLAKYAAHLDRKPYACFATAPSMNGYTSTNAAIMAEGVKKSLPATAPRGVFIDIAVFCRAPKRMIAAGFGDSLCRPCAQADWLLSHLLLDTPYRSVPFRLLAEDEAALLGNPEALANGDVTAMTRLARMLVMSGFGMTLCGGSYPASQGEHLIAHFLEMRGDSAASASFHGEQIAVTTLTMARIQERILARNRLSLSPSTVTEADLVAYYGPEVGAACWSSFQSKVLDAERAEALNARLERRWPEMRDALGAVSRPVADLEAALGRVGAPVTSAALGVAAGAYREAVLHAREIRDRFTFLDFAAESGGIPVEAII